MIISAIEIYGLQLMIEYINNFTKGGIFIMNRRNFWAFMGVLALIFALALGSVGCGGSSSGPIGGGGGGLTLSGHYILIGSLNPESELTPYISDIITAVFV